MRTRRSNMRRLRSGLIGSISAWLPSRRSTAHHIGAVSTTLSGQVRSKGTDGTPPGTSEAKVRYRPNGIDVARWVFHAGWPGFGAPVGVEMVRTEEYASGEGSTGELGLFTVLAPDCLGGTSWEGRPAQHEPPRREAGLDQTPSRHPRRSSRCTRVTVLRDGAGPKPRPN